MGDRPRFRVCGVCGGGSSWHRTRHVVWGLRGACVDVGVADLIVACWRAGVETRESCEDDSDDGSGRVGVYFEGVADYVRFAVLVLDGAGRGPWVDRGFGVTGWGVEMTGTPDPWEWSLYPVDVSAGEGYPVSVGWIAAVSIPAVDVAGVVARLEASA